jgi:hypothetical protein
VSLSDWYLAVFSLGAGVSMLGFWAWVVATRRAGPMGEGRDDFGWHIAAEMLTGALLLAAGVALVVNADARASVILSGIGLGAVVYALVESAGHYRARGDRQMVATVVIGWVFTVPAIVIRFLA